MTLDEFESELKQRLPHSHSRLFVFENASGVNAGQPVSVGEAASIAHQLTGQGELSILQAWSSLIEVLSVFLAIDDHMAFGAIACVGNRDVPAYAFRQSPSSSRA